MEAHAQNATSACAARNRLRRGRPGSRHHDPGHVPASVVSPGAKARRSGARRSWSFAWQPQQRSACGHRRQCASDRLRNVAVADPGGRRPGRHRRDRGQGALFAAGTRFAVLSEIEQRFLVSRQEPLLRRLCGRGYSGPQRCHAVCRVSSRTTQTPADKPPSGSIVALSGRLPGRPTRARPSWLAWDLSPAQGV